MSKIPFGILKGIERPISVWEAQRGRKCNCSCPECGADLEACKGKQRQFFRHCKDFDPEKYHCVSPVETSLHRMAKEIIKPGMRIWLPALTIGLNHRKPIKVERPEGWFHISEVKIEKEEIGIIPDITLFLGEEKIFVEIYVTHKVDDEKKAKLYKRGVATLEIDLSQKEKEYFEIDHLLDLILNKNDLKYWVLSSKINYELERNFKKMDRLTAVHIGGKSYKVIGCPDYDDNLLHEATVEECEDCSFFVKYIQDNGYVICLRNLFESQYGLNNEKRIRNREESSYTTQDISLLYGQRSNTDLGTKKIRCIICNRIADESEFWTYWGDNVGCCNNVECKKKYFEMQDQSQRNKGAQKKEHVCPICGSPLVLRTARKGMTPGKQFYGCSGFPNCRYTENL